jgi:hypothetical protein
VIVDNGPTVPAKIRPRFPSNMLGYSSGTKQSKKVPEIKRYKMVDGIITNFELAA